MPAIDDFGDLTPEDDHEIDQASHVEPVSDTDEEDPDVVAAQQMLADARAKAGNRKQRRAAAKIPDSAPQPQDHKAKSVARQDEAENSELVLTLFGEDFHVDRAALVKSWDWQLGTIDKNPLQMVKGLLGDKQFAWFCMMARGEEMTPWDAAQQIMALFSEQAGLGKLGNS